MKESRNIFMERKYISMLNNKTNKEEIRVITMIGTSEVVTIESVESHITPYKQNKKTGKITVYRTDIVYAISHPEDEEDPNTGIKICLRRLKNNQPYIRMDSFNNVFTEDMVRAIINNELNHITPKNIHTYIKKVVCPGTK